MTGLQGSMFKTDEEQKLDPGARKARQITAAKTEVVPVAWLKNHPKNARQGSVAMVMESLMKHGQIRPLVANKRNMTVLIGNHTLMAMKELNVEEALVSWVDVDDVTELKFLLVENKTNDGKKIDPDKYDLEKLDLVLEEVGVDGTGFTDAERQDVAEQIAWLRDAKGNLISSIQSHARYAETPEEEAERAARRFNRLREMVLLFQEADYPAVLKLLEALDKKWKLKGGNAAVVRKALELCAGVVVTKEDVDGERIGGSVRPDGAAGDQAVAGSGGTSREQPEGVGGDAADGDGAVAFAEPLPSRGEAFKAEVDALRGELATVWENV